MSAAALSLVVSTVGRPTDFLRLLASVAAAERAGEVELVLVDQSSTQSCVGVLEAHPELTERLAGAVSTTSGLGAAHGRNVGIELATAPVLGFPDDNCWFPPTAFAQVLDRFAAQGSLQLLSGQQQTADGRPSMLRWSATPAAITRYNFLRTSIMSTMFVRRSALDRVGRFDERMGVGSAGWYGAGEESDLLLRVLDSGGLAAYDPRLVVLQDEPRDEQDPAFVGKMLRYGCGMGHLWRLHRLSRLQLVYFAARKAAAVAVRGARGQRVTARADIAYLRGLQAGFRNAPPREWRERVAQAPVAPAAEHP